MDILDLERDFKRIDELSDSNEIIASLTSSGRLNVRLVEIRQASSPPAPIPEKPSAEKAAPVYEAPPPIRVPPPTAKVVDINVNNVHIPDEYIDEKVRAGFLVKGDIPGVKVVQIQATAFYEVAEDYTYSSNEYRITAPRGFVYDRASIPRIFWVIVSKDDLSNVPPLFHDLLYANGGILPTNYVIPYRTFNRKNTDKLFLELMQKSGVKWWRCDLAYSAVRNFAAFAWKTKKASR